MDAIGERLLNNTDFQAEVHRLRLSLGAEDEQTLASGTNLTAAGTHLAGKFDLGRNWKGWLMQCLVYGIEGARSRRLARAERIRLDVRDYGDGLDPVITLTIYAETSLEDIKGVWPGVQYQQELLPSYREHRQRATPPNPERNALINELADQGVSVPDIVEHCSRRGWDLFPTAVYGVLKRNRP